MSGLLVPNQTGGFIDNRLEEIDRQLRDGKPEVGWPGDPRLELHIGRIVEQKTRRVVEQKLEVWRRCEDGKLRCIGAWDQFEADVIVFDLAKMRLDSPGHEDAQAKVDKHNDAIHAELKRQHDDAAARMAEHVAFVNRRAEK